MDGKMEVDIICTHHKLAPGVTLVTRLVVGNALSENPVPFVLFLNTIFVLHLIYTQNDRTATVSLWRRVL